MQIEVARRAAAMLREETAFRKLHASLYPHYAGKYVAIYNEQRIDSDADQVALYRRVWQQHPGEFVWIAPMQESPDEVLVFRSPRLLNGSDFFAQKATDEADKIWDDQHLSERMMESWLNEG